jgi:hypothetical protein
VSLSIIKGFLLIGLGGPVDHLLGSEIASLGILAHEGSCLEIDKRRKSGKRNGIDNSGRRRGFGKKVLVVKFTRAARCAITRCSALPSRHDIRRIEKKESAVYCLDLILDLTN